MERKLGPNPIQTALKISEKVLKESVAEPHSRQKPLCESTVEHRELQTAELSAIPGGVSQVYVLTSPLLIRNSVSGRALTFSPYRYGDSSATVKFVSVALPIDVKMSVTLNVYLV
jgi:hypothetical protein